MIEAYVTNLGKYNEGYLYSEPLRFPATQEEVKAVLSKIGVDGVMYEELFIADYNTNLAGMQNLGEYERIDELNYLASLISDMDEWELEKFEAAAVYGDHNGSVKELINLTQNLDCYEYYPGVSDYESFGRYLIEELEYEEIPERLEGYIDYEAYGRDYAINEDGEFVDGGFVFRNSVGFQEHYDGRHIPDEYRIFAYPDPPEKMTVRDQLKMYGKMVSDDVAADRPAPARCDR